MVINVIAELILGALNFLILLVLGIAFLSALKDREEDLGVILGMLLLFVSLISLICWLVIIVGGK